MLKPRSVQSSNFYNKSIRLILVIQILFFSTFLYAKPTSKKELVILGDSLTEGLGVNQRDAFPKLLETKLKSWKVINSGISGSTTASAQSRAKWILKSSPEAILILLGANDGLRGVSTSETEKNLDATIELIKSHKIKVLLGSLYLPPNYGQEYTERFKSIFPRLAKKHKIPLVPFILEGVAGFPALNQADGIHPNEKGHQVIAENLFKYLKDHL